MCMVKSTPSPTEMEESSAVTMLSSIPLQPMNPNVQSTANTSGSDPRIPAARLLKMIEIRMKIATRANRRE